MPSDQIIINDLLVRGLIGVNDWERREKQDILIQLTLFADLRRAGRSDDVADTINYRDVTKRVIARVEEASRFTVEALAEDVAKLCLALPGVARVRVRIDKPGAVRFARTVGVEIERGADEYAD